jgi:mannose-6-phosphate isomerase-like protein (cupin superfamily)
VSREVWETSVALREANDWEEGLRPHLKYRELGLSQASGGGIRAQQIRVVGNVRGASNGWHYHELAFQFFFVVSGSITLRTEDGRTVRVTRYGSGNQPPGFCHDEYDFSPDYEVIEITAPATVGTVPLDDEAVRRRPRGAVSAMYRALEDLPFEATNQPGVSERLFGTDEATGGRFDIRQVQMGAGTRRATGGDGGRNFWLLVLEGTMGADIGSLGRLELKVGDAVTIAEGTAWEVHAGPEGVTSLEMSVSADLG